MFPLGLAYISAVLKENDHEVECLNLNHCSGTVGDIVGERLVKKGNYDFVCTGGLSPEYKQIKIVVDAVKRANSGARIIMGGGIMSSEPEIMFHAFNPDFAVIGEGETTIVELLSCIQRHGNPGHVPGVALLDDRGKFIMTGKRLPIMDLDRLPIPDFEGFDFETYLHHQKPTDQYFYDLYNHPRVYPIVTSRSCPFLCTFCFHPLGNKYRQRSIDDIMYELDHAVKKYRINLIAIYDELFSFDRERVFEFCERIKVLFERIPWECKWGCQMRVDRLDENMLATMAESGCHMVSYGFESYSTRVLKSMKKHIRPDQIDRAVDLTLKHNLSLQANFIFGDRSETSETARDTLNYWKEHNDAGIMIGFVNPYPGTALYHHLVDRGIIENRLDFIENHIFDVFNMTDTMAEKEFNRLQVDIFDAHLKYRMFGKQQLLAKASDGTYTIRVKCPHCRKMIEYLNYSILFPLYFVLPMYCRNCRRRFFVSSNIYRYSTRIIVLLYSFMGDGMKLLIYNIIERINAMKPRIKRVYKRLTT